MITTGQMIVTGQKIVNGQMIVTGQMIDTGQMIVTGQIIATGQIHWSNNRRGLTAGPIHARARPLVKYAGHVHRPVK